MQIQIEKNFLASLVLSVYFDNIDYDLAFYKLQEAINLTKSLNIKVSHSEFLKLRNPSSGNFLSKGKGTNPVVFALKTCISQYVCLFAVLQNQIQ